MSINIRNLYTKEAIINYLTQLPVLFTPVMDSIFSNRPQIPLPLVGADMIKATAKAMPLARRGSRSITVPGGSASTNFYEPFPIRPDISITGADLNNLKVIQGDQASLSIWAQGKTDILRRTVRATTEGLCATALSGTLSWPVQLDGGGFETYEVQFGTIQSVDPAKLFDAVGATLKDVFSTLRQMHTKLREKGYGGKVEVWAGTDAYNAIFALAENNKSTSQMVVRIEDQGLTVGGYLIKPRDEQYYNPQTKAMVSIVDAKTVKMIALDAGHQMPYCAIDDLDGNLQPMPFFVKPIKTDNPSGYQLVAEAKPFPIPNVDGICDAVVTA
ncbi:MAG: major capsid protein [Desulfuromonadaceae bacterium]|nr:major capsid protein [Desulfuromonadaceae bacterium]MDD2855329.1 major capsid protein [Desulfuromonadaceae bacterium]